MRFALPCCLAAIVASASGCVIITDKSSSLTIDLTFGGIGTCEGAGVDELRVSSPTDDFKTQTVDCDTIFALSPLPVGTYRVTVEALASGVTLFQDSVDVKVVAAGTAISMDLVPIGMVADFIFGAPDSGGLHPPGMTCAEAGAQSVTVKIDGANPLVANCHDVGSNRDAAIVPVNPGTHTFEWAAFSGVDGAGTKLYSNTFQGVTVTANSEVLFSMAGVTNGGFEVDWHFPNNQSCAGAGVTTITYDVFDASGAELPALPHSLLCDSAQGFAYPIANPGLTPGVYKVDLKAKDSGGNVIYRLDQVRVYAPAGTAPLFDVNFAP